MIIGEKGQRPAKWRQVYEELVRQIEHGELAGVMPSVLSVARHFDVGTSQAQKAIAQLRADGLLVVEHGAPTRIVEREQMTLARFDAQLSVLLEQLKSLHEQVQAELRAGGRKAQLLPKT